MSIKARKRGAPTRKPRKQVDKSISVTQDSSTVEPKRQISRRQSQDALASPHNNTPLATVGGLITERRSHLNQNDEGFLSRATQLIIGVTCYKLGQQAAQGHVEFLDVWLLATRMDRILESVGRPNRWELDPSIHAKRPPGGSVPITGYAATYLSVKCDQVYVQSIWWVINVEVLDGLIDVIRPILQPMLDAYRSGSLELGERSKLAFQVRPAVK